MAIYSGFSHQIWWFSIVMLVYQRVSNLAIDKKLSDYADYANWTGLVCRGYIRCVFFCFSFFTYRSIVYSIYLYIYTVPWPANLLDFLFSARRSQISRCFERFLEGISRNSLLPASHDHLPIWSASPWQYQRGITMLGWFAFTLSMFIVIHDIVNSALWKLADAITIIEIRQNKFEGISTLMFPNSG
jgi:hypothetical protein